MGAQPRWNSADVMKGRRKKKKKKSRWDSGFLPMQVMSFIIVRNGRREGGEPLSCERKEVVFLRKKYFSSSAWCLGSDGRVYEGCAQGVRT